LNTLNILNFKYVEQTKKKKGFAAMDPDTHRAIAKRGGDAVSRDREHMATIGKKGGISVKTRHGVAHMAAIGSKGGKANAKTNS
jgi:general stress protein YciG